MNTTPTQLERLHQLFEYPSDFSAFNTTYEKAAALVSQGPMHELYVVQSPVVADGSGFCSVPAPLITEHGPYYLTDICAAVRKPRVILHADCTTCGPVSDAESDISTIAQDALTHTATTGHVVVLNGTCDVPE